MEADSPTAANVTISPLPAEDGPWPSYNITLCPIGGGTCLEVSCTTPANCPVTGLQPDTTYVTTVEGVRENGTTSPPSHEAMLTTPSAVPVLTSAAAAGPTTAQATATPPEGVQFKEVSSWGQGLVTARHGWEASHACAPATNPDAWYVWVLSHSLKRAAACSATRCACPTPLQYIFTAVPKNGTGPNVTVVSPTPDARLRGLLPNTEASCCWGACVAAVLCCAALLCFDCASPARCQHRFGASTGMVPAQA